MNRMNAYVWKVTSMKMLTMPLLVACQLLCNSNSLQEVILTDAGLQNELNYVHWSRTGKNYECTNMLGKL